MKESIEFKNITLFPKKTSLLGLLLSLFLFLTSGFIILTMWNTIEEIDEFHFPMVERSSINVRLVNLVNYQFKLALNTKSLKVVEDLKLNLDSLKQNYKSLQEKSHNSNEDIDSTIFIDGKKIIALLNDKKWNQAESYMKVSNFSETLESFSFRIFDETEDMAMERDDKSQRILNLINKTSIVAILTIIFLIYLAIKIYKGYGQNLKERLFAEERAKILSHQRQALIHVLCHDLGNPVSAIYSLTEVGHLLPPEEKEKMLGTIKENAKVSLDIIELTRKMQALETGKFSVELKETPLKASVEKSLTILKERFDSKELVIEVDIASEIRVIADETSLINSILNNLFTNSIKFSFDKGIVKISSELKDDMVSLTIQDFGMGIPANILPHLFSETVQTSRNGTAGEEGTGFGMPLVKKFIDAYGGSIEIISATEGEKRGTTSILTFKTNKG